MSLNISRKYALSKKSVVFNVLPIIPSQDKTKAIPHTSICKKLINKIFIQKSGRFLGEVFEWKMLELS